MNTPPHPTFLGLRECDWEDTSSILQASMPIFGAFTADSQLLPALLHNLADDEHLKPMCERYDFLDKLVLYDDMIAQVRIRLHLYRPGYSTVHTTTAGPSPATSCVAATATASSAATTCSARTPILTASNRSMNASRDQELATPCTTPASTPCRPTLTLSLC